MSACHMSLSSRDVSQVNMLKSLRHPRVVLFMGACLNPGNLAIVTEYLPRNSLYQVTCLVTRGSKPAYSSSLGCRC